MDNSVRPEDDVVVYQLMDDADAEQTYGVKLSALHPQDRKHFDNGEQLAMISCVDAPDKNKKTDASYGESERLMAVGSYIRVLESMGWVPGEFGGWIRNLDYARECAQRARREGVASAHFRRWQRNWRLLGSSLMAMVFFAHLFTEANPDYERRYHRETGEWPETFSQYFDAMGKWPTFCDTPGEDWFAREKRQLTRIAARLDPDCCPDHSKATGPSGQATSSRSRH